MVNEKREWLHWQLAAALSMIFALQAHSGVTTFRKVEIELTGAECDKAPDHIWLIFDGNDRDLIKADRDRSVTPAPCIWKGSKEDGPALEARRPYSVRLQGARSDCRYADERKAGNEYIGFLKFAYEPSNAVKVTITPDPIKFYVSYEREVPQIEAGSVACLEGAFFLGSKSVDDVMFPLETLRLSFAQDLKHVEKPDPWISVDDPLWEEFKGGTWLSPDAIGAAHVRSTAVRPVGSAARFRVNEGSIVFTKLKEKGLKQVGVKVE